MLEIIRWLIAIPLLSVSLYFILTNFRFLRENFRLGLNAGPAPDNWHWLMKMSM